MIDYNTAKQWYQESIRKLVNSLQRYAESDTASQRKVNHDTMVINNLVDFFNAAEADKARLESNLVDLQLKYSRLHQDAQRLVLFCSLHGINPNMVFYYSTDELQEMIARGVRIAPPKYELKYYQPDPAHPENIQSDMVLLDFEADQIDTQLTDRYLFLKQFCYGFRAA